MMQAKPLHDVGELFQQSTLFPSAPADAIARCCGEEMEPETPLRGGRCVPVLRCYRCGFELVLTSTEVFRG